MKNNKDSTSPDLRHLLNRCLTDHEFCMQVLTQPAIVLPHYNISQVECECILHANVSSLEELVAKLHQAGLIRSNLQQSQSDFFR